MPSLKQLLLGRCVAFKNGKHPAHVLLRSVHSMGRLGIDLPELIEFEADYYCFDTCEEVVMESRARSLS